MLAWFGTDFVKSVFSISTDVTNNKGYFFSVRDMKMDGLNRFYSKNYFVELDNAVSCDVEQTFGDS